MHLAAPITAHPLPASPVSSAAVNAQGNSTSAAAHFGDLVLERAGPVQLVAVEAGPTIISKAELPADSDLQPQSDPNSGANSEPKTNPPCTAQPQAVPSGFSSVHVPLQVEARSLSARVPLSRSAESATPPAGSSRQPDSSVLRADCKPQATASPSPSKTASTERKSNKAPQPLGQTASSFPSAEQPPSSLAAIPTAPVQTPVQPPPALAVSGVPSTSNNTPPTKPIDPAALTLKPDMVAQATEIPLNSGDRSAAPSISSALKAAGQPSTNSSSPSAAAIADGISALSSSSHSLTSDPRSLPAAHSAGATEQAQSGTASASLATLSAGNSHLLDTGVAASARAAQPAPAASPIAASSAPPAPASPNVYDKIEQGSAPVLLHSGTQHVAVGLRDPNLGWVEIKAQNTAGRVDATLVTPSSQIHVSLAAQLPAMAQYLVQRDVRVGSLAVHHQSPGANPGGNGANNGGANAQSQSGSGNPANEGRESPYSAGPLPQRFLSIPATAPGEDSPAFRPVSYISVRA